MKLLPLTLLSIIAISGCHNQAKYMQVNIQGTNQFPKQIVGVWTTQDGQWEIAFLPDGSIREVLFPLGAVRLQPGKILRFEIPRYHGKAEYEPGLWMVFYDAEQRELTASLEIRHFYHDVGNHAIEGNNTDVLCGRFSEDFQEWTPDLQTQGHIEALLFDGWTLKERKELVSADEPQNRGVLLFKKNWNRN